MKNATQKKRVVQQLPMLAVGFLFCRSAVVEGLAVILLKDLSRVVVRSV